MRRPKLSNSEVVAPDAEGEEIGHGRSRPNPFSFLAYQASYCSGFGGLEVACRPLVPKFAGSHPAKAVGFLG